jgi:predicted RNA-binding Zn ribbon-like protein
MDLAGHPWELVAGWPALELTNTVNARPHPTRDTIATPAGLIAWALAAGVIGSDEAALLHELPDAEADLAVREARELRETIFAIFAAIAEGRPVARHDLDDLTAIHLRTVRFARLEPDQAGGFELRFLASAAIAGPVAQSALDLLRDGPLDRVKACPSCVWLFLDHTKNRSRRWCSMATCGSRDKMRRYHGRRRGSPGV